MTFKRPAIVAVQRPLQWTIFTFGRIEGLVSFTIASQIMRKRLQIPKANHKNGASESVEKK